MNSYQIKTNFIPLKVSGITWVASDTHLGADCPKTNLEFIHFLQNANENTDNLLLVGDIFDAWFGDDLALKSPPDWLIPIINQLQKTAQKINLYIGTGNRDFFISHKLCNYLGAHLLTEQVLLQTAKFNFLLSHGDEYCTSDTKYQRYRRFTRNKFYQKLFLLLSLNIRRKIAQFARKTSKKHNEVATYNILDVNPETIDYVFTTNNCKHMIHGHTHRPAIHDLTINDQHYQRIVLPDWDYDHEPVRGGYLIINDDLIAFN